MLKLTFNNETRSQPIEPFDWNRQNEKIKSRLIGILGGDVLNRIGTNRFECVDGRIGSNWFRFIPLDRTFKTFLPDGIFSTEFMNKLNTNKDLITSSTYSMKTVSEIKINTIQFIVDKIH